ncbi:class I SAM-dependent methyltransferase [Butyrivibrio proteoclasticus]|uniref:class I SAM-dependent methyltransferase n=1 Tax=Butyrivibrio proteoclasticus TaxID=43305 RepID=UPI00047AE3B6|nr:class I SAM-dependent methyltransferase [Butyrivibrio proteoclasticus]
MSNTYNEALKFWNSAFEMNDEEKEQFTKEIDSENGWKELASSEKLRDIIIENLSGCAKVLDYGCGEGWAGITINKSGCKDVTCVDVVENAITLAKFLGSVCKVTEGFKAEHVSTDWIESVGESSFDGIFCSNVIDVLPAEVAENIIKNIARIATKDAKIIISMNYYEEPVSKPEKNLEVKNGNEIYLNGVLRMVSRTDEEWTTILSKYFNVEKIEYFAWPGETKETRRIFILKNK